MRDVNFTMDAGVYGLLGPNGAGKTTLISILAGLIQPTAGQATVCGYDPQRQAREVRKNIGIIPQDYLLYPEFSAYEFLDYMALLSGIDLSRQKIIDGYIVDFYCHATGLVVEVDDGGHLDQQEYDRVRDAHLTALGRRCRVFSILILSETWHMC